MPGDAGQYSVFQHVRLHAVAQRRERQKDDAVLLAELEHFPFRQVRVRLDLPPRPV
jgi:hypothetical protein